MQGSKAPTVPWTKFQTERVSDDLMAEWFADGKDLGLAVVCGQVSDGLTVLDFDSMEAYGRWAEAYQSLATSLPTALTGRGAHVFFKTSSPCGSCPFRIVGETEPAGDILAERMLCILPPTIHAATGKPRTWLKAPESELPTLQLSDLGVEPVKSERPEAVALTAGPVPEGQRHQYLTSMAGRLRNLGMGSMSLAASLEALNGERCSPPLAVNEVKEIADWAATLDVHSPKGMMREEPPDFGDVPHDDTSTGSESDTSPYDGMFLSLSEYLRQTKAAEVDWLVEGFLPVGYLAVLGGTSKAGKSCFLTTLAMHVAEGREFMGLPVRQSPVLWLALEESETERRIAIESYDGEPDDLWTCHERIAFDKPDGIEALRYWVRRTGARLLVVDPLYAGHSEQTLSDGSAARRVLQPLKELARTEGLAIVMIHHITKSNALGMVRERLADSGQIVAACSMDVLMDATEMADGSREIVLHCRGRGEFANQNWLIRSTGMGEYTLVRHGRDVGKGAEATDQTLLDGLEAAGTATAEQLAKTTGIALGTVRNRLIALRKDDRVTIVGKQDRSNLYQAVA